MEEMNPCLYFNLKQYFSKYCFDERIVPVLTPEKLEEIRKLSQETPELMKVELQTLEDFGEDKQFYFF